MQKDEIVTKAVLSAALAVCLFFLQAALKTLRTEAEFYHGMVLKSDQVVPVSASGVDIQGRLVDVAKEAGLKRIVMFGVRRASAEADIAFWAKIAQGFRGQPVQLVGYCDGFDCVDVVKQVSPAPGFSVFEAGDVSGTQAVFLADEQSASIVADGHLRQIRRVVWRGRTNDSDLIRAEILQ